MYQRAFLSFTFHSLQRKMGECRPPGELRKTEWARAGWRGMGSTRVACLLFRLGLGGAMQLSLAVGAACAGLAEHGNGANLAFSMPTQFRSHTSTWPRPISLRQPQPDFAGCRTNTRGHPVPWHHPLHHRGVSKRLRCILAQTG